jgi:hypothetical protein
MVAGGRLFFALAVVVARVGMRKVEKKTRGSGLKAQGSGLAQGARMDP